MSKQDFLQNEQEFIGSVIYGAQQCENKLTENEWRECISEVNADIVRQDKRQKLLTEEELNWIIEALDDAGVVAE